MVFWDPQLFLHPMAIRNAAFPVTKLVVLNFTYLSQHFYTYTRTESVNNSIIIL